MRLGSVARGGWISTEHEAPSSSPPCPWGRPRISPNCAEPNPLGTIADKSHLRRAQSPPTGAQQLCPRDFSPGALVIPATPSACSARHAVDSARARWYTSNRSHSSSAIAMVLCLVLSAVAWRLAPVRAAQPPLLSITATLPATCPTPIFAKVGVFWSSDGLFAPYEAAAVVVYRLYAERVAARCGIGGIGIQPEFLLCDIHSDVTFAPGCAAAFAAVNVTAVMLSEGPTALNTGAAMAATGHYVPMLAGASGTPSVFRDSEGSRVFPQLFGVTTPAPLYFSQVVSFARLNNYRTAAIVSAVDNLLAPDESVCQGAIGSLVDNSITLVYGQAISLSHGTDTMDSAYAKIRSALAEAQLAEPDVLFTCFATWCPALFQSMSDLDFNPNIHSTFECGNQIASYPSIMPTAMYTVSPSQFHCGLIGQQYQDDSTTAFASLFPYSYGLLGSGINAPQTSPLLEMNVSSSARQFCDAFAELANGTQMTSMTGTTMAALYLLDYGISTLQSLDGAALVRAIQSINLNSFFGLLNVDRFGENSNRQIPLLQLIDTSSSNIVWPPLSNLIVPMPTFAERIYAPHLFATSDERAMLGVASLLTVLCCVVVTVLLVRRNDTAVRAPSALLSALVLIGVLALAWAPATWLLVNNEATCAARISVWLVAFAFILTPVTLQAYRVHRIRSNRLASPVRLPVPPLLARAMAGLIPLGLLWVVWCTTDNLSAKVVVVDSTRPSLNYVECTTASSVLPLLMAGGVTLYLAAPVYYAFRIRSVSGTVARLNNARLISVLLLLSLLCVSIVLAIELALPNTASVRRFKFDLMFVLSHSLGACVLAFYFFDQVLAACTRRVAHPSSICLSLWDEARTRMQRARTRPRSQSLPGLSTAMPYAGLPPPKITLHGTAAACATHDALPVADGPLSMVQSNILAPTNSLASARSADEARSEVGMDHYRYDEHP